MKLLETPRPGYPIMGQLAWFGFWLVITGIALWLHPAASGHGTHEQLGLAPCPSVLIMDRPCPGCGLTTSWTAFVHGDFRTAFHAHPLGPILYLGFTASAWIGLVGYFKKQRLITDSVEVSRFMVGVATVFLCFGLIRMAVTPHYANSLENAMVGRVTASR